VEHWQRGAHVEVSAVSERGWPVGPARQLVEPARAAVGIGPRGGKMHLVPEMKQSVQLAFNPFPFSFLHSFLFSFFQI
jgi:hypothetical protein